MNAHTVIHESEQNRFVVTESGHTAYLTYYLLPDGSVDLAETHTPLEIRGRGITSSIIRCALEWARAEDRRVVPGCPFVATYVDRHHEFESMLVTRVSKR